VNVSRLLLGLLLACDPAGGGGAAADCPEAKACECDDAPKITLGGGRKPMPDKGDIQLVYKDAKKKELAGYRAKLENAKMFDKIVEGLNETVAFPKDWAILMTECGRIDAYYDSEAPGVVLCYELLEHFKGLFAGKLSGAELEKTLIGATFFAFLHETGHALVDQLDLPITGKEEDAVDQLAAVILIESGGTGLHMALDGARAFLLHSKQGFSDNSFWDEHSFEEQRYYSIVCLAFGADPKKRTALLEGNGALPRERAATCAAEYKRVKKAWTALLAEHGKA
jgi:hypothetical protein